MEKFNTEDLVDGYTEYTSAEELELMDAGANAPAFSPAVSPLVPILIRASIIAASSSTRCAESIARATGGVAKTIKEVC
jgi:hypothetical protein